jgi:chromosome segregation ATPase
MKAEVEVARSRQKTEERKAKALAKAECRTSGRKERMRRALGTESAQRAKQRVDSRQQTAENREQRAESREQRAESREQRAESRQQRAESRQQTALTGNGVHDAEGAGGAILPGFRVLR